MKTVLTAILAVTTTLGSFAHENHPQSCPVNCGQKSIAAAATQISVTPEAFVAATTLGSAKETTVSGKKMLLEAAHDDLTGYLNFRQTMSDALTLAGKEKHLDALEDIEAQSKYNNLMTRVFRAIEAEKFADANENLQAFESYNNLMQQTLSGSSAL